MKFRKSKNLQSILGIITWVAMVSLLTISIFFAHNRISLHPNWFYSVKTGEISPAVCGGVDIRSDEPVTDALVSCSSAAVTDGSTIGFPISIPDDAFSGILLARVVDGAVLVVVLLLSVLIIRKKWTLGMAVCAVLAALAAANMLL
jgi:hypothetical protein